MTRTTAEKIALFRRCFTGRLDVYGTFDPASGRVRQVKAPVTNAVILAHLQGRQPYGVYLLVQDHTQALTVDFDHDDLGPPMSFVQTAKNYGIATYIERSKSRGYHVWTFFPENGVLAAKSRLVAMHMLNEIGEPDTEIFPKHDRLDAHTAYGNYINAPLFGALVPRGRTVFVEPGDPTRPCPDQWALLEAVRRIEESTLDAIIEINELRKEIARSAKARPPEQTERLSPFGLAPCAQRMLANGVTAFQRVSCFRLAVQLKRIGIPFDLTVAALMTWAGKNRPTDGKQIITESEIREQASSAYNGPYRCCGCEDPAVKPFCDSTCPVRKEEPVS
jgi:hypothetical protein